jgi:hypothetical protein
MKRYTFLTVATFVCFHTLFGQSNFEYRIEIEAKTISGLPGIHSYVFAQSDNKWLIIGGRLDGIHGRQPFSAFPSSMNNKLIYVVDPITNQYWTSELSSLSTSLKEQLQSTNMNFFQEEDTLVITGGYGYSASASDHITFPYLTSIRVSKLMESIVEGETISDYFRQLEDSNFQVTGGRMGKIGNDYLLVGGQQFTGRYNPLGHNTYVQSYTNSIRRFRINHKKANLEVEFLQSYVDPVHLRRRDYNLLPQIFPDKSFGYAISSGVFQPDVDLPYLYPVDIRDTGYSARTEYNQYLSNYHGACAHLYDGQNMHSIFFGGLSQYYYENDKLIKDDNVPFVKTVSRFTRNSQNNFEEHRLDVEMSNFSGASAEFIPNPAYLLPNNEILDMNEFEDDTMMIGYVFGGLTSSERNPFSSNRSSVTEAANSIFAVKLIKDQTNAIKTLDGKNPYHMDVSSNPINQTLEVKHDYSGLGNISYWVYGLQGEIIVDGTRIRPKKSFDISIPALATGVYFITLSFDNQFFVSKKILIN